MRRWESSHPGRPCHHPLPFFPRGQIRGKIPADARLSALPGFTGPVKSDLASKGFNYSRTQKAELSSVLSYEGRPGFQFASFRNPAWGLRVGQRVRGCPIRGKGKGAEAAGGENVGPPFLLPP